MVIMNTRTVDRSRSGSRSRSTLIQLATYYYNSIEYYNSVGSGLAQVSLTPSVFSVAINNNKRLYALRKYKISAVLHKVKA